MFIFLAIEELHLVLRQQTSFVPNMSGNKEEAVSNFGLLAALVAVVEHPPLPQLLAKLPKQVKLAKRARPALRLPIPPAKPLIPVRQAKHLAKLARLNRPLTAAAAVLLTSLYSSRAMLQFYLGGDFFMKHGGKGEKEDVEKEQGSKLEVHGGKGISPEQLRRRNKHTPDEDIEIFNF